MTQRFRPGWLGRWLGRGTVFFYLAVLYFPIYWMVTMAFKRRVDITTLPPKIFFEPILDNFEWLFVHQNLMEPLLRSFYVTTLAVGIAVLLGTMAAFALSRYRWPAQNHIEFWIISTRMLPPVAVIIPFYAIFIQLRLLDNLNALAFTYLTLTLPLVTWLLLGFLRSIPREIDEAARIDGANSWQVFWYVTLPIARSGIATAAVLAFIFTWGELFFAFIIMSVSITTPVALVSLTAVGLEVKYGEMAAAGTIVVIPSLVMAILFRNTIVKGFRSMAGV
ncbi:MAG: carbohydrate ABC transporter permease [Chloroflexi bacterium]|nr:carbohydrate ABC transporter permease [Chloroflexota bacterium]